MGDPDRPHHARGRLWRPGGGAPGRPVGSPRQSRLPAQGLLRRRRGQGPPDREGRGRGQLRSDRHELQRRGGRQGGQRGHRRHAPLHHRTARALGAAAPPRARLRRIARLHRACLGVPDQRRSAGHPHLHRPARDLTGRRRPVGAAQPVPGGATRPGQLQRADELQHGAPAGDADAATPLRRSGRLLHGAADGLRRR